MKYSIVIPHLSTSRYIDECIKYIEKNSMYKNEIIRITDEQDVYYAFNKGVYISSCDTVVLINDDMIVSKYWDQFIPIYTNQNTVLTGYVVEPNPGKNTNNVQCIEYDCGTTLLNFDYDKFQQYVNRQHVPNIQLNQKGWYMPLIVNKKSFISYPNINKFPEYANDILLIDNIMPFAGFKFAQINMWVYHFARQATFDSNALIKKCIFTYCNHQIDENFMLLHQNVVEKFNNFQNCKYEFLKYLGNDGEIFPDQAIDYAFNKLFYEDKYDVILMLDIDCIPLDSYAIEYVFNKALQGYIIGNIQRSNHINNNEHVYIAPSAICISKKTFEKLNKPSFAPTYRSDIGEELCFMAEEQDIPLEMFLPKNYEQLPLNENNPWELKNDMPRYGIGTTFIDSKEKEMFYHLFQSRYHKFNNLFFDKCISILTKNN